MAFAATAMMAARHSSLTIKTLSKVPDVDMYEDVIQLTTPLQLEPPVSIYIKSDSPYRVTLIKGSSVDVDAGPQSITKITSLRPLIIASSASLKSAFVEGWNKLPARAKDPDTRIQYESRRSCRRRRQATLPSNSLLSATSPPDNDTRDRRNGARNLLDQERVSSRALKSVCCYRKQKVRHAPLLRLSPTSISPSHSAARCTDPSDEA